MNTPTTITYHRDRRQRYVFEAIRQHIRRTGKSPTNTQLSRQLGLARPTISRYVTEIEQRGWIVVTRGDNWRTITIIPEAPVPISPTKGI